MEMVGVDVAVVAQTNCWADTPRGAAPAAVMGGGGGSSSSSGAGCGGSSSAAGGGGGCSGGSSRGRQRNVIDYDVASTSAASRQRA